MQGSTRPGSAPCPSRGELGRCELDEYIPGPAHLVGHPVASRSGTMAQMQRPDSSSPEVWETMGPGGIRFRWEIRPIPEGPEGDAIREAQARAVRELLFWIAERRERPDGGRE